MSGREDILHEVIRLAEPVVAAKPGDIKPDDTYNSVFGSLDEIEFILALEEQFDILLPVGDEELRTLNTKSFTMRDLANLIADRTGSRAFYPTVAGECKLLDLIEDRLCPHCRYDNSGLDSGTCPECGGRFRLPQGICTTCGGPTNSADRALCDACRAALKN